MLNVSMKEPSGEQLGETENSAGEEVEAFVQPRWYAKHTCANHERRVTCQLAERSVEYILAQRSGFCGKAGRGARRRIREDSLVFEAGVAPSPDLFPESWAARLRRERTPRRNGGNCRAAKEWQPLGDFFELIQQAMAVDVEEARLEPLR